MPNKIRELFILRHAKSAWDTGHTSDFERPLNERGQRDAPRMGAWMREQGLRPDLLVSSPAERARLTAEAVAAELGLAATDIRWEPRIYMADEAELLHVLAEVPADVTRVLLVGHNPGMEELTVHLARPSDLPSPSMGFIKTATFAQLRVPDPWDQLQQATAELVQIMRPKNLPEGF